MSDIARLYPLIDLMARLAARDYRTAEAAAQQAKAEERPNPALPDLDKAA